MSIHNKFVDWVKKWWWLVVLTASVCAAVAGAYNISADPTPLDAVGTGASLLLSVFLVYIYSRQNKILERQGEIFESQYEIQEAVEATPELDVANHRYNSDKRRLTVLVENIREGDAYKVGFEVVTQIRTDRRGPGITEAKWRDLKTYHIKGYSEREISGEIKFPLKNLQTSNIYFDNRLIRLFRDWRRKGWVSTDYSSFEDWSAKVISELGQGENTFSVSVCIDFNLIYESSTGNKISESVAQGIFEIDGVTVLRESSSGMLEGITLRPDIGFSGVKPVNESAMPSTTPVDCFMINVANQGSATGHISKISSICSIIIEGKEIMINEFLNQESIKSRDYGFTVSNMDLEPVIRDLTTNDRLLTPDATIMFMLPYRFLWNDKDTNDKKVTAGEIHDALGQNGFDQQIEWSVEMEYYDDAGNTYSSTESFNSFLSNIVN